MDQEGQAPPEETRKVEVFKTTQDFISQNVDNKTADKFIFSLVVDLIDDAWLLVFSYLGIADRTRIARICKRWRDLSRISWKSITWLSFRKLFMQMSLEYMIKRKGNETNNHISCWFIEECLQVVLPQCGTCLQCLDLYFSYHFDFIPFNLTPLTLDLIGHYGASLQELNLSRLDVTEETLKTLAKRLPRLKSLHLQSCKGIRDNGLWWVLNSLQSLKSLNVSRIVGITGEFFSQAPQSLTKVRVFMEHCKGLTGEFSKVLYSLLAKRCPDLETIDISYCNHLTGQSFTALVKNCPKLKNVKFIIRGFANKTVLTSEFLTLSSLPLLDELNVDSHISVTDQVFYELGRHCPLLRSISCQRCHQFTDAAISHLSPCLHLESINVNYSGRNVTDDGLIQLSSAHSELNCVYLMRCKITDRGVGHLLSAHPNLLQLDISSCQQVTDKVLPMLKSSLQRRQHTQPLMISLRETSVNQKNLTDFAKNCDERKIRLINIFSLSQ